MSSPSPAPDGPAPATFDVHRPFTRAEAREVGISDQRLQGRGFRRLLTGVYVSSRVPDRPWLRTAAALLVNPPGAVASHHSAARLLGAPVPGDHREHVTCAEAGDRRQRHGVRCHVAALAEHEVRVVEGLRITAPARLFADLAAVLPLVDAVVLGDWLLRRRLVSREELEAAAHGRRDAELAASYVRERVDSPMETRLRLLLVLAGIPEPQVNVDVHDARGTFVARVDLVWPGVRLAVEYDGQQHLTDTRQWERDVDRVGDLEDERWRVVRVTSRGIYRTPEETLTRVWKALRERRFPGLRPPGDDWRAHFPH